MPIESTRFSVDGRLLMVNGSDHTVRVIDVQTGDAVGEDMKHGPAVKEIAFSQDARKMLTIDAGANLHLWGPPGTELRAPIQQVGRAWFAPDGSSVAVLSEGAGTGSDIRVWKTDSGYPVSAPMRQSQRVDRVTFSRSGEHVLVEGGSALLWQLESGGFHQLPDEAGGSLWATGFGPAGASLLITGDERTVRIWDVEAGHPAGPPMNAAGRVDAAWLAGPRPYVVVQSFIDRPGQRSTPVVEVWDGDTGRRVGQPLESARVDTSFPPDPDGHRLIVRMESGQLKAWNLSTSASAPAANLPERIRAARIIASGLCLASTAGASVLRISTWPNGAVVGQDLHDTATVEHVRLAPDCQRVATIDKDQRLRIWDTHTGRFVVPRRQDDDQFGFFQDAVFSPDGAWFATQANDGSVRVWSASTGAPRTVPLGYVEFIRQVSFSSDGRYVMAEGDDAAVMVWDASTGEQLVDFPTPPFLLHNSTGIVAWSPDATRLVVGAEAFIKDISTVSLIVRVQDLAPDSRSLAALTITAQLMAGRKLDESGAFVNLTTAELSALARQAPAK
jgi:WD40 repeat protein